MFLDTVESLDLGYESEYDLVTFLWAAIVRCYRIY